jgi:UDP-N-acetylmuramyl pentapeptide phosphotransferase/UDP-N-acetylglucosamine-1-phosphate transferase
VTGDDALVPGLVFGVTAIVVLGVLLASQRWRIVDVPDERSAHSAPTPTMGGIGISVGIAAGLLTAPVPAQLRIALLLALAILLVAVVDDLRQPLSVARKLAIQLAAAISWALWAPQTQIQLTTDVALAPGLLTLLITVSWLLWLMNVFNFMDGIDGFTSCQTIAMSVGLALLLPIGSPLESLPRIVIAACLGFLLFNMPPARIFMGDVGSLSLGFLAGVMVLSVAGNGIPLWLAAMPLTVYFVDTSYTVVRRFQRGENVLRAHKEHLYQQLVHSGWSHLQVDAAAIVVTGLFAAAAVFDTHGCQWQGLACAAGGTLLLAAGLWWKECRRRV